MEFKGWLKLYETKHKKYYKKLDVLTSAFARRKCGGRECLNPGVLVSSLRLKGFRSKLSLRPPTRTMPLCRNVKMP